MLFTTHAQGGKVGIILDHFKFMILNLKTDFILTDHSLTIKNQLTPEAKVKLYVPSTKLD